MQDYGIRRTLTTDFETVVRETRDALQTEGFGVLTEIDMQGKLKEKLGVETSRYLILGACNPPLAWKALQAEPEVGLLLPCNVIVYDAGEGKTVVSAMNPDAMLQVIGDNPAVEEVARDAKARLTRALERL